MSIPAFTLPSDQTITVQFREATIQDCLDFSSLDMDLSEKSCSEYLNSIQVGEISDSRQWTMSDRVTALWWIFCSTSPDTLLAFDYKCAECGENHIADIDMIDFDSEASFLNSASEIEKEITCNNELMSVVFKPLNGYDAEYLEQLNIASKSYDRESKEYKQFQAKIDLSELALSFYVKEKPELTVDEKVNLIKSMSRISEYVPFILASEAAQAALKHGLNYTVSKGSIYLNSPAIIPFCKKNSEVKAATFRLLIPFQSKFTIPSV